jgi:hypothetical protein
VQTQRVYEGFGLFEVFFQTSINSLLYIYIYCNAHIYIYILLTLKQIVVRSHAVDAEAPQAARPSEQGAALRATDVASDRMCHDVTESGKVGKTWVSYGVF